MQVPLELKIKYLGRRIQDIEHLLQKLEEGDYTVALKLGHQVKGNAVTFDVPQIANLGSAIEKAALIKDKDQVRNLVQKMESEIQNLQSRIL